MITPQTGLISRPEEAVDLIYDLVLDNSERLGIEFVGKYDERLIPRYPAVVVSSGILQKEVHATHTFGITLRTTLWVYHGNLTVTHKERSEQDLLLVTALVSLLEDDPTFNNQVVFGYVESETPGVVAPRSGRGDPIVGTRMAWEAVTQARFD